MRIVHLIDYFSAWRGYQEYFLAKEQIKEGHQVFVVTSDRLSWAAVSAFSKKERRAKEKQRIVGKGIFKEDGITVYRLPVLFELFPRLYLRGLKKALLEIKPDVVHCHSVSAIVSLQTAFIKRKGNFRLVYDEHMIFVNENKSVLGKLFYFLFPPICKVFILKRGDAFVAVSEETIIFMNKKYGIPLSRIKLIYQGADPDLFKFDAEERSKIRKQFQVKEDEILIIYTGKITFVKKVLELLECSIELLKSSSVKVLLVGNYETEYKEKTDNFIRNNKVENRVIFKSFVPNRELYKYYSAADIGVWPGEPTISTLEASSCSLPIIIEERFGMRERIGNNNGFAYKEGNLNELKGYIELLARDDKLRKEMGKNGRELIENKLSWGKINQEFMKVYLGR